VISWKDFTVVVPRFARYNHILVLVNRLHLLLEITLKSKKTEERLSLSSVFFDLGYLADVKTMLL